VCTWPQVFGEIPSTCSAQFGSSRVPAVSASVQALSETAHTMQVTAPALNTSGRVPISLTCRSAGVVDTFVMYVSPPGVSSIVTEGECTALKECSFLVTIDSPPDTIKIIDDLTISTTGAEFVARAGTLDDDSVRVFIVAASTRELVLRVQTPPALAEATLSCALLSLHLCV
jgi:hypothetical protein